MDKLSFAIFKYKEILRIKDKDFANAINVDVDTINNWRMCKDDSYKNYIDEICKCLGVTYHQLMIMDTSQEQMQYALKFNAKEIFINIENLLYENHKTKTALMDAIGVVKGRYWSWENGISAGYKKHTKAIALFLGVSEEDLLLKDYSGLKRKRTLRKEPDNRTDEEVRIQNIIDRITGSEKKFEIMDDIIVRAGKRKSDLYKHLDISKQTYICWKTGINTEYEAYIAKIAEFLETSIESLEKKVEKYTAED